MGLWRALPGDVAVRAAVVVLLAACGPLVLPILPAHVRESYRHGAEAALLLAALVAIRFRFRQEAHPLSRRFWNLWTAGIALRLLAIIFDVAADNPLKGLMRADLALNLLRAGV